MNFKKHAKLVAFFAVTLMLFGCTAQAVEKNDFSLKDTEGKETSLAAELKTHKAVLINFWATWCPPCREEIPGLIELQKNNGGAAFTILGIDIGESEQKVTSFMKRVGMNYPVLLDKEQSVAEMYHVVGIPTSYLITSDGKIVGEYHGFTPNLVSDVEKAIK